MEDWRSAQRAPERRLWGTLFCVGVVLTVAVASSIVGAALSRTQTAGGWFYLQQSVLLMLGAAGTALAFLRFARAGRAG
jgi:Na+/phosphate symporter